MREIVYKYRSFNNPYHLDVIRKNQLFLAAPLTFNDPFDIVQCDATKPYLNEKRVQKGLITTMINQYLKNNDKPFPFHVQRLFGSFENLENELYEIFDYYIKSKNNIDQIKAKSILNKFSYLNDRYLKIGKKVLQHQHYGIVSLSKEINSILMWSHYGDNHNGFAIGFYKDELENDSFFNLYGDVNYSLKYPSKNMFEDRNSDNWITQDAKLEIFTKSQEWAYEKEYRLAKLYYPEKPENHHRIYTFNDSAIAEMVIGTVIKEGLEKEVKELKEIAIRKNIPIYQMVMDDHEFKLNKDRRHYP